jgi:predicted transcriptional regulator YdeE
LGRIAGKRRVGPFARGGGRQNRNVAEGEQILAVCGYNETNEDVFPYMICAENAPGRNPDGYKRFTVPKTTWAVFRAADLDEMGKAIPELFDRAYLEWLPVSSYEKSAAPDLEIYGVGANGKFFEEAWIPVVRE